ncbi:hypothetical protein ACFWWU_36390 [Streptomyces sp. NPDC058650]|uniref:hypothetical protein n=1 Tax=Streptomyces sp. NPDC058650 TaxID=3346575 RepID=UPI003663503F
MSGIALPLGGEHCSPIDVAEFDGAEMRVGDRITFRAMDHSGDQSREVSVTGELRELYVEKHPSTLRYRPEGSVFAEVLLTSGTWARCWFMRDRPRLASDLEGTIGAAPEGAMF